MKGQQGALSLGHPEATLLHSSQTERSASSPRDCALLSTRHSWSQSTELWCLLAPSSMPIPQPGVRPRIVRNKYLGKKSMQRPDLEPHEIWTLIALNTPGIAIQEPFGKLLPAARWECWMAGQSSAATGAAMQGADHSAQTAWRKSSKRRG